MKLGAISLPAGAVAAATSIQRDAQGRVIWHEGDAPIPVYALEEIGVTATRDYLPAMIAGVILALALSSRKRG
jgi:hypothetical protein